MIHILFVSGAFGSMVRYVARQYNSELADYKISSSVDDLILSDGSMHSKDNYVNTGHWRTVKELEDYFDNKIDQDIVLSSPLYPMADAQAESIIKLFNERRPTDKYIFIYAADLDQAELIILAKYYKIANGVLNGGLKKICDGDNQHNLVNWNPLYTSWSQMQPWELRVWFSIFYPGWCQEWIDAKQYVPATWLLISSGDILANTSETLLEIINHVGKFDSDSKNEFDNFVNTWRPKQQYLIDEHTTIKNIVEYTVSNTPYTWGKLNVISEAIVQRQLRDVGYEIRCYNLNELPTNSIDLYQLLDRG